MPKSSKPIHYVVYNYKKVQLTNSRDAHAIDERFI